MLAERAVVVNLEDTGQQLVVVPVFVQLGVVLVVRCGGRGCRISVHAFFIVAELLITVVGSGEVHTRAGGESFHPRHIPLQCGVHLETVSLRVIEAVIQQRLGRTLFRQSRTPCLRSGRHGMPVHRLCKHITYSRLVAVRRMAVQVEGEFQALVLQQIGIRIQDDVDLLVVVRVADTFLLQITQAGIVLDALATAPHAQVGLVHRLHVVEHIPRIVSGIIVLDVSALSGKRVEKVVDLIHRIVHAVLLVHHVHDAVTVVSLLPQVTHVILRHFRVVVARILLTGRELHLIACLRILVSTHALRTVGRGHGRELLAECDGRRTFRTTLGGDHHYTVLCTRTVNRGSGRILQHRHGRDIVRTQAAEELVTLVILHHHIINHIKDLLTTTDPDTDVLTRGTGGLLRDHTGHTTSQTFRHGGNREFRQLFHLHYRCGSGHGLGFLYATVTGHHHFVQHLFVTAQCYADRVSVPFHLHGLITDKRDLDHIPLLHIRKREFSVHVGESTISRSFNHYGRTDYRLACFVQHDTRTLRLLLSAFHSIHIRYRSSIDYPARDGSRKSQQHAY